MSPDYIGVNQSNNLEETLAVAEKYLREGRPVSIYITDFGDDGPDAEHHGVEFEVHVDFDKYSQVKMPEDHKGGVDE